ncbi:NB-ARC domain-containing protein [Nocardiopsis sp. M1B1]|uniref:NB-ARC domain-containing protein n=1 Tax=Nocardiopsis sp. M1B1 TaxID=3450454 RepID=UPI00403A6612
MDGGRVAARGFEYQYLRTIEATLIALSDPDFHACHVEGDPLPTEGPAVDIVDFAFVGPEGRVLQSAQVKSGGPTSELRVGQVVDILAKLISSGEADRYALLTNTRTHPTVDALARVLAEPLLPEERRTRLAEVLRRTNSLSWLNSLDKEELNRLGRCVVKVDSRDRAELDQDLREALRKARRQSGRSLGHQSSGLLLAYLQAEAQRRAGDRNAAEWTAEDLREALTLDDQVLADALGQRDWGGVLGEMAPIPDVPRQALLDDVAGRLLPYRENGSRKPGLCVLAGLSGIGKSSLAAAYLAEYADAYDIAFWVDSSNEDTAFEGFRALARKLGVSSEGGPGETRSAVFHALSSRSGRWLMILDDAREASVSSWVPRMGNGDVLVTSLNRHLPTGSGCTVLVEGMRPEEAVRLLTARLELTEEEVLEHRETLKGLAASVEHWPLALELVSRYLHTCGYRVVEIPEFVGELRKRAYADRHSVPDGYPRTLVASINLSLELIAQEDDAIIQNLSYGFLFHASYLNTRRIPLHLVIASLDEEVDLDDEPQPISIYPRHLEREVIRTLTRANLIREDHSLPETDPDWPEANVTVTFNSVLQEVLGGRFESITPASEVHAALTRLSFHTNRWLWSTLQKQQADRSHSIYPQASSLVEHLIRLEVTSAPAVLLMGNLASFYHLSGKDPETAISLLRREVRVLEKSDPSNGFLINQARLHLASAAIIHDDPQHSSLDDVVEQIGHVLVYAQRLAVDSEFQGKSATFCVRALAVLERAENIKLTSPAARQLTQILNETLERLPITSEAAATKDLREASQLLSSGDHSTAEQLCRRIIREDNGETTHGLEARRFLIEALFYQHRWSEGLAELKYFIAHMGTNPLFKPNLDDAMNNIGLQLAGFSLFEVDTKAQSAFLSLMSAPGVRSARATARGEYAHKYAVLELVLSLLQGNDQEIRRHSTTVLESSIHSPEIQGNIGWSAITVSALQASGIAIDIRSSSPKG